MFLVPRSWKDTASLNGRKCCTQTHWKVGKIYLNLYAGTDDNARLLMGKKWSLLNYFPVYLANKQNYQNVI